MEETLDSVDDDELEEEADAEVDKVLFDLTDGKLGQAGKVGADLPVRSCLVHVIIWCSDDRSRSRRRRRTRKRWRRCKECSGRCTISLVAEPDLIAPNSRDALSLTCVVVLGSKHIPKL